MIFTTYWFLLFTALTVLVFRVSPYPRIRMGVLVIACLIFHAHFAGPAGMLPIIVMMVVTYCAGYFSKPWLCLFTMAFNIGALVFYKYTTFLLSALGVNATHFSASFELQQLSCIPPSIPPLGVSFFAFEFVHYLFDVRKGSTPIRNPIKFLLFSIFFPSLVAGPIKRYQQFIASVEAGCCSVNWEDLAEGLKRIAIGFAKKILLADNLTFFINYYHPQYAQLGLAERWLFSVAIGFRILLDFSGYSDIAIGTARLFGVRLPENFNWPYLAKNISEFWQRWHISLSGWIRDYVYIPLGGSRIGLARKIVNGLIAFALCGLWHGPAWNFVIWGIYHGVGLGFAACYPRIPYIGTVVEMFFSEKPLAGIFLTQIFVFIGWFWFFYPAAEAWNMIRLLFHT